MMQLRKAVTQGLMRRRMGRVALLCIFGISLNLLGSIVAGLLNVPFYFDSIGTILVAAMSGTLPGIAVGFFTNILKVMTGDYSSIYYGAINVLLAMTTSHFARKGYFQKVYKAILLVFVLAFVGGGIGSVLTWFLFGFATEGVTASFALGLYNRFSMPMFAAQFIADYSIDVIDKFISIAIVYAVITILPNKIEEKFRYDGWQQRPLSEDIMIALSKGTVRRISLRTKILLLLTVASLLVAIVAVLIGYYLFRRSTIEDHTTIGESVSNLAASVIDPDKVDDFLEKGEDAEGYKKTEDLLYGIRNSSPDILYLYVYRIEDDGCHVVFDLDTIDGEAGSEPGDVIPFDESFSEYVPHLLKGEDIPSIITNDSYGWLLTSYTPVYDSEGRCVCYAAADISMTQLITESYSFLAKQISLFTGFFILVLAVGLWLAEYGIIYPVNSMAYTAKAFAYDSEEVREDNVDNIGKLEIHTGDEIENLYGAFSKTTADSMKYFADVQAKQETIAKMQSGLIMVLADMVENRDKCTGDHIKKTAAYTELLGRKVQEAGLYPDIVTDEYVSYLRDSAPLHDIGKIAVSDLILNKTGKLTDEEFAVMKSHTSSGRKVIEQVIEKVPESGYLKMAANMANYHHEKFDGSGYPEGLKGDEIPLSARIMTIADVFDALVSRRSYKKPYTFEEAMNVIKEGAGTHFDPTLSKLFIEASDEVRKIADDFSEE